MESVQGALLRRNRSIQSEGTFGVLKWDKSYKRLFRRGEKKVILELTLISCGFNLYKYHYKKAPKSAFTEIGAFLSETFFTTPFVLLLGEIFLRRRQHQFNPV